MVDRAPTLKLACDSASRVHQPLSWRPFPTHYKATHRYSPRDGQLITQFKYSSQEPSQWITGSDESDDDELAFPVSSGRPTFFLAIMRNGVF